MQWTTMADIVRAVAAGVTAVIAALKFIYDIRQKQQQLHEEIDREETPLLQEIDGADEANSD